MMVGEVLGDFSLALTRHAVGVLLLLLLAIDKILIVSRVEDGEGQLILMLMLGEELVNHVE